MHVIHAFIEFLLVQREFSKAPLIKAECWGSWPVIPPTMWPSCVPQVGIDCWSPANNHLSWADVSVLFCFFLQSCTQISIGDLLFNEQNYQPGSLSVLITDADSKNRKKRPKALSKVTFNDRKGLKVITKHLKEQVNSPRRKITGDSSWVVLLLIAICYTFWRRKTFSPTSCPPPTEKLVSLQVH